MAVYERITDQQLVQMQANPDIGFVVDAPYANAPLIIAFGFVDWTTLPAFDFARRLRKLETGSGQRFNRILVRDTANLWYQHGVTGLGQDVDSTAASLRRIIGELGPPSVGTIGQSMGAYAAILFGTLLEVDRVLAFGPLSYLRSDWAERDGDRRWLAVMQKLDLYPPTRRYDDLPALIAARTRSPSIHIVFGSAREADGTANMDALHGLRFAQSPCVIIEEIPEAPHAVVKWLIDARRIDGMIQSTLLQGPAHPMESTMHDQLSGVVDTTEAAPGPAAFDDGWRRWIAENLVMGVPPEGLLPVLVNNNFHPGEAQREIDKAQRSPYLLPPTRLVQRVAKRDWMLDLQRRTRALGLAQPGIARRHKLSRADFLKDHYSANRPVVITGMIDDWPALQWTPELIADRFADRIVQVQANRNANPRYESEAGQHQQTMRFGDFMERVLKGGECNDIYMTANNGSKNVGALRELWDGIIQVPEYLSSENPDNQGFFWIGPAGTVTPTHHDLTNNFMAQIMGRKRVHLVDGLQTSRMYNHLHVYSEVDLENIDYERFPLMREVEVLQYDLMPGELLFIPVGWWHHVRALDISMTVTFINFVFDNDFYSMYQTYNAV